MIKNDKKRRYVQAKKAMQQKQYARLRLDMTAHLRGSGLRRGQEAKRYSMTRRKLAWAIARGQISMVEALLKLRRGHRVNNDCISRQCDGRE